MTAGHGRAFIAGLVLVVALLPTVRAGAQAAGLIDEIGPGWAPGELCRAMQEAAIGPMACFEHDDEQLTITAADVGVGVDARSLVDVAAKAFAAYPTLPTPDLDAAQGFVVSSEPAPTGLSIVVGTAQHVFTLIYTSGRPLAEAVPFVTDVAARQQDHDGGAPPNTSAPDPSRDDAKLDQLLIGVPPGSGLVIVDTSSLQQTFDDFRATSRSQRVIDLLNGAPTRQRVFQAGPVGFIVVSLTEQAFGAFAATQLGGYRTIEGITDRRAVAPVKDAIGFRFQGGAGYGVVFRRGPYLATVTAISPAANPADGPRLAAVVDALAVRQAALLPSGGTAAYVFPSTARSIVFTVAFTTAACLMAVAWARLAALRRRRSGSPVAQGPDAAHFGDAVDVDGAAAVLRRQGYLLLAGQIVAVNVVVVGVLGVLDVIQLSRWVGLFLIGGGLAGGVSFTSWRARAELEANGGAGQPVRGLWRSPLSIAAGLFAAALLVGGAGLAAVGLAGFAFGPSLSVLERSKALGLGPEVVSLLTALIGVALLVLGGVAVRLARMWARAGAARERQRDQRPPVLYLRSFDDDSVLLAAVLTARRPFLELFLARGADPFEEAVAWELASYGPVTAIGRPGRPVSSLGAARDRLPDDEWQTGVAERMADARAVIMVLGSTDGVRWELGQIVAGGCLTKTVFVFPPVATSVLDDRWRFTAQALSAAGVAVAPLPAPLGRLLTAVVDERGQWHVAVTDRKDEASYRVALDHAMGRLAELGQQPAGGRRGFLDIPTG